MKFNTPSTVMNVKSEATLFHQSLLTFQGLYIQTGAAPHSFWFTTVVQRQVKVMILQCDVKGMRRPSSPIAHFEEGRRHSHRSYNVGDASVAESRSCSGRRQLSLIIRNQIQSLTPTNMILRWSTISKTTSLRGRHLGLGNLLHHVRRSATQPFTHCLLAHVHNMGHVHSRQYFFTHHHS